MAIDVKSIRSQFPIFNHEPGLIYLDNAATSQKPASVIRAMNDFYERSNANVHRGLYKLSSNATKSYENARAKTAALMGAKSPATIAFTKGATESINIVAQGFLKKRLQPGDTIVVSAMEHHANFIPWQQICLEKKCRLQVIPVDNKGDLIWQEFIDSIRRQPKLVAVAHMSNVLGTINPIKKIVAECHEQRVPVLVDAAQSIGHLPLNVSGWQADFVVFSAHKMFGPMGTGVLYARDEVSHEIDPLIFGGGAIKNVTSQETDFLEYPYCLEAGTPNVAGVLGLGASVDFINSLDLQACHEHTRNLATQLRTQLKQLPFVKLASEPNDYGGIVSFSVDNIHAHDAAGFLAERNIAVRAGHHCTQPLHEALAVPATIRVSFSIYNTIEESNAVVSAIKDLKKFWS